MQEFPPSGFEGQCRRIAAWSLALQRATQAEPAQLPDILQLAEALDQHFAWEPFVESDNEVNPLAETALSHLRMTSPAELDGAMGQLQSVAASSVNYMEAERAARTKYTAALEPLFAARALQRTWRHSLEAADVAQSLAEATGAVDPQKAFLAGLVHDIGRLAIAQLPNPFQTRFAYLNEMGCETFLVEQALSGFSHAQLGARTLKAWSFPESLIEAVEFHHQPERSNSKFSALLYLTEEWTDDCEDAPSRARFHAALNRLDLTLQAFGQLEMKTRSLARSWSGLPGRQRRAPRRANKSVIRP
jgi:putative nucleotidyltransferase with HDIG domain